MIFNKFRLSTGYTVTLAVIFSLYVMAAVMLIGVLAESPANTYSSVTVDNCYDTPAEYEIKILKKGDIVYVKGLLKPASE
jgi:hypothetical protein